MDYTLLIFFLHHFHLEFLGYLLFLVGPDILGSLSVFDSTVFIYKADGPGTTLRQWQPSTNKRNRRPLNPVLRMEASPKSVIRKEKKLNPVIRKERKREVPVHEAPIQEAPLHEAPSVDGDQDPPGDLQVGVDDHRRGDA